jgi:hypothetical protein
VHGYETLGNTEPIKIVYTSLGLAILHLRGVWPIRGSSFVFLQAPHFFFGGRRTFVFAFAWLEVINDVE